MAMLVYWRLIITGQAVKGAEKHVASKGILYIEPQLGRH